MRRFALCTLILSFPAISLLAQSFEITGLSPSSGSAAGGTSVVLQLNALANCPILDPGPAVTFGDTLAPSATKGPNNTIVVTTPAHAPGIVDVKLEMCGAPQPIVAAGAYTFVDPAGSFRVLSMTPSAGSTLGGTEVVFQLDNIPFCFDPVPPANVTFDGIDARSVVVDDSTKRMTAVSPQHAAGVVDVLVQTCGGPQVLLPNSFTYDPNLDPAPSYEKVLFPVVFAGPGALGSMWGTSISIYNSGDVAVDSAQPIFASDPRSACPAVCGCGVSDAVEPKRTSLICVEGFQDPAGLIYYPRKSLADQLAFGSRVFDLSRSSQNRGTEIPVVRERDFRTDHIILVDVPLDPLHRVTLRVYDPDQHDRAQVRMSILDPLSTAVIGERTITLSYPIQTIFPDPFPIRPAFASVGDLQAIVRAMIPASISLDHFHVRLTPVTPGIRIWGFASITNNDTQMVTTVTPQ